MLKNEDTLINHSHYYYHKALEIPENLQHGEIEEM